MWGGLSCCARRGVSLGERVRGGLEQRLFGGLGLCRLGRSAWLDGGGHTSWWRGVSKLGRRCKPLPLLAYVLIGGSATAL